jgi:hypothetical protein
LYAKGSEISIYRHPRARNFSLFLRDFFIIFYYFWPPLLAMERFCEVFSSCNYKLSKDPDNNLLVKFAIADDMIVSAPVKDNYDSAPLAEVDNIEKWTETNRMTLNLAKTWEMIVSGKLANPPPEPIAGIERKTWLKLLGIKLQNDPSCWGLQVDYLLSRASGSM